MYGWLIYDKIGLERNTWFIERLLDFAARQKEDLRLIRAEDLRFGVQNGKPLLTAKNEVLPDYAIVRTIFPMLSRALTAAGVRVFNNARVSEIANDKRRTQALAARLGIPTPDTLFFTRSTFNASAQSYPAILKSTDGHGGNEVFYVEDVKSAGNAVESLKKKDFLLQEPVDFGRDIRVYLLGGKVLCAVERRSETDFRSNFSLGGSCALYTPTKEMLRVVKRIDRALKPTFVGVDFIFKNGAPMLNEIEDIVGSRMVYKLTDLPVHELLLTQILNSLKE